MAAPGVVRGLVLQERIELSTSPLPRECSTTELLQRLKARGLQKRPASCHSGPGKARRRKRNKYPDCLVGVFARRRIDRVRLCLCSGRTGHGRFVVWRFSELAGDGPS